MRKWRRAADVSPAREAFDDDVIRAYTAGKSSGLGDYAAGALAMAVVGPAENLIASRIGEMGAVTLALLLFLLVARLMDGSRQDTTRLSY